MSRQAIRSTISIFRYEDCNRSNIKISLVNECYTNGILSTVQSSMLKYGNGSNNQKGFSQNELGVNVHVGKIFF